MRTGPHSALWYSTHRTGPASLPRPGWADTNQPPVDPIEPPEPSADPRPVWERMAYTWLEREVDAGHQVDPAALAAEVSVTPRLAGDLVRVLRAQRHRDPALSELRGRLVRDRITDAYLGREPVPGAQRLPAGPDGGRARP